MTEVLLFHHAQGLTTGVHAFAGTLRAAGHTVHTPDLYDGRTFAELDAGLAYADEVGFETVTARGHAVAETLAPGLVYAGFSLGVLPAQSLTQTRPGALGALLFHSCVAPAAFGTPWPPHVPVQIHGMDGDDLFTGEGDLDAARDLVASTTDAELFLYPGKSHLFADPGLPDHDPTAATLLTSRVLSFLADR